MDFFVGHVTREHEDVDLFVWSEDADRLVAALEAAGFVETGGPPPEAQRDLMKDGVEVQIALLALNDEGSVVVAGGPSIGAPWPEGMLQGPHGRLGDLVCPIVNPWVQIEIKEQFPTWRPDIPAHPKHGEDIHQLRAALSARTEGGASHD